MHHVTRPTLAQTLQPLAEVLLPPRALEDEALRICTVSILLASRDYPREVRDQVSLQTLSKLFPRALALIDC